jgi:uncharacterized protein YkwD
MVNMAARIVFLYTLLISPFSPGNIFASSSTPQHVSAAAIIDELNLARQNPLLYAGFIDQMRMSYAGNMRLSGTVPLRTHEGISALDEAIRFLRTVQPQSRLALSSGLCQAAADHCRDQAGGAIGHNGSDRSNPASRINRHGVWQGGWAENIAYGQRSARDIVLALIIDDGVRGRGHRRNIFNPTYNLAGAAYGPHARFGSVCDIDFAGAFVERALASAN